MTSMIKLTAAALLAAGLAACGGGGTAVSTNARDTVSGSLDDIGNNADSLELSELRSASSDDVADGESNVLDSNCEGRSCTPGGNTLSAEDLIEDVNVGGAETISDDQGVTVLSNTVTIGNGPSAPALIGYVDGVAFGAGDYTDGMDTYRFGWALGSRAESRPSTSGTYNGQMTGIVVENGDLLRGSAVLEYMISGSSGELDATFSNIRKSSDNALHRHSTISFSDVEVMSVGTFSKGTAGNRIKGAFYGGSGTEIAGTFENQGIHGAFGARSNSQ